MHTAFAVPLDFDSYPSACLVQHKPTLNLYTAIRKSFSRIPITTCLHSGRPQVQTRREFLNSTNQTAQEGKSETLLFFLYTNEHTQIVQSLYSYLQSPKWKSWSALEYTRTAQHCISRLCVRVSQQGLQSGPSISAAAAAAAAAGAVTCHNNGPKSLWCGGVFVSYLGYVTIALFHRTGEAVDRR